MINDLIKKEQARQFNVINLIASENYTFKSILKANGSILTNKYAEGYPSHRYYGGCENMNEIESLAINRAKQLFGADHANVQPLSGTHANAAAYLAFLKPNDVALSLDLSHGGHLSHGLKLNFSGKLYNFKHYYLSEKTFMLDYDAIDALCEKYHPKLILCGYSSYSRTIDFARFRKIADKHNAILMADIAHIAGLIAAKVFPSPIPYADVVTSTTQKSLNGPRGGLILCKSKYASLIDKAVFPGMQGGPHMNTIASKAICFLYAMTDDFVNYQKQVIKNAKAFAQRLLDNGFDILTKGTDNHMFSFNVKNSHQLTGKKAIELLAQVNIIGNKNLVVNDTEPPMIGSGVRFGVYAPTTLGFIEDDFIVVADVVTKCLSAPDDQKLYEKLRQEVHLLINKYKNNFSYFTN